MELQKGKTGIIDALFKTGAHFGYSKARRHPSTKPFIFGSKNNVEILDLEKTSASLEAARGVVADLAHEGKTILFVGTKPEARKLVVDGANAIDMPYVSERWIGGTLTNFSEIKKRVARLEDLLIKREKGELSVYTKKERLLLDREIAKLQKHFGGIVSMKETPRALFIVDPRAEHLAVREAVARNVPIIALASSDCDVAKITYPIVANDSAMQSIRFFVEEIVTAYREGKATAPIIEKVEPREE